MCYRPPMETAGFFVSRGLQNGRLKALSKNILSFVKTNDII